MRLPTYLGGQEKNIVGYDIISFLPRAYREIDWTATFCVSYQQLQLCHPSLRGVNQQRITWGRKGTRREERRLEVDGDVSTGPEESGEVTELSEILAISEDALDTEDEDVDPSFDLDSSLKDHMVDDFCEEWVLQF